MAPEDVVYVLRRFREALRPTGLLLDLQVIRPHPRVEVGGGVVCKIDGTPLFETADAATAGIDGLAAAGLLAEEAVDDHDALRHYESGAELVREFEDSRRIIPPDAVPLLERVERECVVREHCRLRRLVKTRSATGGA